MAVVLSHTVQSQKKSDTLSIIGVGDIMLGTAYPDGYLPPSEGKYLLKPVESILKNADVTFGNHEGTLFDGKGTPKQCQNPSQCYAFKSPEKYATYLANAGFDVMSVANNHSGDFGPAARLRTMEVLGKSGIAVSGTTQNPYCIFEKNKIKYGLASFAPNPGTPSINKISEAKTIVEELKALCDIVIVSFHGGGEGASRQHVTRKSEIFLGENRGNVYQFAHAVIDAGADIVFGHGPHVTRAVELYKDRFIIYSMGNFATYGRFNLKGVSGIAPIIKVYVDKQGKFLKGKIFATKQEGEGGPVPDASNAVIYKIQQLTNSDFPESVLLISDNGNIEKKEKTDVPKKTKKK